MKNAQEVPQQPDTPVVPPAPNEKPTIPTAPPQTAPGPERPTENPGSPGGVPNVH